MGRAPDFGPDIATVAQLLGDRTRASMVSELTTGEPLSASSLAALVKVSRATASEHLARLVDGGILLVERIGRHAYYRLASKEVVTALDALAAVAPDLLPPPSAVPSGREALNVARTCYDHLGGRLGVALTDAMEARGLIRRHEQRWVVEADVWERTRPLGITCTTLRTSRRTIVRGCADWSGSRHHIAGSLAAAVTKRILSLDWLTQPAEGDRTLNLTRAGVAGFRRAFGLSLACLGPGR